MHAASITVTNTNDNGPGSLRQALAIANDGDTINFAVTGTITLTSGGLPINKNITISGPGADHLSIDGNQAIVVFGVFDGKAATISGLTVRNAQSGVLNDGTVTVTNCVLSDNSYDGLSNYGVAAVSSVCLPETYTTASTVTRAKQLSETASSVETHPADSSTTFTMGLPIPLAVTAL